MESAAELSGGFPTRAETLELIAELKRIRGSMLELVGGVDLRQFGERSMSAANLLHYVALRRLDVRELQEELSSMGVSSLGRSESHVLYTLDAVISLLEGLTHEQEEESPHDVVTPAMGREALERNSDQLFGHKEEGRRVKMMVTMPSEAADDYLLVKDLVAAGMDVMRVNCAHDDQAKWGSMVDNLRKAEREVGRRCRVLMDIAGPKLRTGKLEPGPQVMKIKPPKDEFGRVTAPARLMLVPHGKPSLEVLEGHQSIEVSPSWLKRLRDGTQVVFRDSRGSRRAFTVVGKEGTSVVVECGKTAYVDATTKLKVVRGEKVVSTTVYNIPHLENPILLKKGESVVVTASQKEGCGARRGSPARVPCTLPEALRFVKVGERIWFDDGKIGGVVRSASKDELRVEITSAGIDGSKLREDKGINLPDTDLRLPALTAKDYEDLGFIAKNADMVGYSFVRTSADLGALRRELEKLGREDTGVVLKIESARSFEQLPSLLLESMKGPLSGVMIARGDLAVECGFERLAEVQEEILWMSEAAHMPTVWATQVLEGMAKSGFPTRAEVTDAAMGERAECVMLNKGPHIVEALKALDSILRRMQAHQVKKQSMMRQLKIASGFLRPTQSPA